MKKKKYSATYNGKTYFVFASCEEEVWHTVLNKNGIEANGENSYSLAETEKMEIRLA